MKMFEKGGIKIAVLGQAFPYQPIANPRWLIPKWSFGIREEDIRANVEKAAGKVRSWWCCCRTTALMSTTSLHRA